MLRLLPPFLLLRNVKPPFIYKYGSAICKEKKKNLMLRSVTFQRRAKLDFNIENQKSNPLHTFLP